MKLKALLLLLLLITIGNTYAQQDRKIENATAFAKLYGYVKYFHPSDEAAAINWERFAIYGSKQVENCKTPEELKATLTTLFQPIAPTVKIYLEDEDVKFNQQELTPSKLRKHKTVAWQHMGLGFGDSRSPYKSARTNRPTVVQQAAASKFGSIAKRIEAANYVGKEFILEGKMRMIEGAGTGHLWARIDKADKTMGFFENMSNMPATSTKWQDYKIEGTVDKGAATINIGAFLSGTGEMWLDDISFKVKENGIWKEVYAESFTNEKPGKAPTALSSGISGSSKSGNSSYNYTIQQDGKHKDNKYVVFRSVAETPKQRKQKPLFQAYPQVGEYTATTIGGGLKAIVPLALYGTTEQTYPETDRADLTQLRDKLRAIPAADLKGANLYTRLGDITITWNIFQHFYPYFEIANTDWHQDLRDAIARAYTDQTTVDFQKNLQKLTAKLQDGHVRVVSTDNKATYRPPITWEWVENKLVITNVLDANLPLAKGDIVTNINGTTPEVLFENIHQHISAATKGWLYTRSELESLLGEQDSELHLTILKADNTTEDVKLKRSLTYQQVAAAMPQAESIKTLGDGIMYINLDTTPMEEISKVMPQLQQSRAIICDLRGYPKGNHELIQYLLPTADTSKQWMQVPQLVYPDQEKIVGYQKFGWLMKPKKPQLTAKVIFLTDGSAISYAESYMSFIEHYKLATIVGQPTAGTNGNINPFLLPGGYQIPWTGMKVQKHDGSQLHGVGIIPDVFVEKTIKGVRENRDEFLEKAIEIASTVL
ncbi:S41 family peptidase [Pontibacter harenae]|uniref:S41 family peptidase n=1 Tax=Pontibacter harenae TaxID=2894083 RepID=UPI001E4F0836|nr:S41 family peptidase [Pontibacter harenae]MCC9167344.1 peptidase S41 [Pontibacter harenae]